MDAAGDTPLDRVVPLPPSAADDVVDVLGEAFAGYPVMRYVMDGDGPEAEARARVLVRFFVMARFLKGEPVLGILDDNALVACALVTPPGTREAPPELERRRADLWRELGEAVRRRYERLGEVWGAFPFPEPHHHLNMVGTRASARGLGLGRALVTRVVAMSEAARDSRGVSLTTEASANLPFYGGLGFDVVAHAVVTPSLETWGFFRSTGEETG